MTIIKERQHGYFEQCVKMYQKLRIYFFYYEYLTGYFISFQKSVCSTVMKILISISTVILLGMILAYHALEVQVRRKCQPFCQPF